MCTYVEYTVLKKSTTFNIHLYQTKFYHLNSKLGKHTHLILKHTIEIIFLIKQNSLATG